MLIKSIGSVLIISCGVIFGMKEKAKFARKTRILKGIINALDFIHSEISFMRTPTCELFEKLSKTGEENVSIFFDECKKLCDKRKELQLSFIWGRTLKEATYLNLSADEENTLRELGGVLGRYDAEEQLKTILHIRKKFEDYLQIAEEEKGRLGRLYGNLSVISGVALVIILL